MHFGNEWDVVRRDTEILRRRDYSSKWVAIIAECHGIQLLHTIKQEFWAPGGWRVLGRDITRYHEDAGSDYEDDEIHLPVEREGPKPTLQNLGDNEWTARLQDCLNCGENFNLAHNEERVCVWHPSMCNLSLMRLDYKIFGENSG